MGHSPRTQVGAGGEGRPGAGTGDVSPSLSLLHPCPGRWKSCPRAARRPSSSSSSPAGSEGAGAHGARAQPRASPGLCRLCQLPADACALLSHPHPRVFAHPIPVILIPVPSPCQRHSQPCAVPKPMPSPFLCDSCAILIPLPTPCPCHSHLHAISKPVSSPSPCPCPPHAHVIPFPMPMPSQACAMPTITLCQHCLPTLTAAYLCHLHTLTILLTMPTPPPCPRCATSVPHNCAHAVPLPTSSSCPRHLCPRHPCANASPPSRAQALVNKGTVPSPASRCSGCGASPGDGVTQAGLGTGGDADRAGLQQRRGRGGSRKMSPAPRHCATPHGILRGHLCHECTRPLPNGTLLYHVPRGWQHPWVLK